MPFKSDVEARTTIDPDRQMRLEQDGRNGGSSGYIGFVLKKPDGDFHFAACSMHGLLSQLYTGYVAQARERDGVQFGRGSEVFFLYRHNGGSPRIGLDPLGAF